MRAQQPAVQRVDHLLDAVAIGFGDLQTQLLADGLQKLDGRDPRIEYDRHVRMMRHAGQQGAHHRSLAGAHLAGELDEPAGFVDAVQQMRERLGVALAQIEIARIRRDGEGLFAETEEAGIHGCPCIIPAQASALGMARLVQQAGAGQRAFAESLADPVHRAVQERPRAPLRE